MAHHNTVIAQLLRFVSRHEFERLAIQHHKGRKLRKINRWSQFVALATGQLSGRRSLRDIVINLQAQLSSLYHLGCRKVARTSLARVNEQQPYTLYEALFSKLYARCRSQAPKHRFRFKNKLYSLDASVIDLSLSLFPWAHFCRGKAAVKLHVGLDHDGLLPAFGTVTHGHISDIEVARTLDLPKQSIVVCDRGYQDYEWFKSLTQRDIYFVTRLKKDALHKVVDRRKVDKRYGLICDQTIKLTGTKSRKMVMPDLRKVSYRDPETGQHYVYVTNLFHLSAKTIVAIYKDRWQIELFFKWLKQNLKIKSFLGTSKNAIMTQIWVALCIYLLLAYLKFMARINWSMQQLIRLLQLNLFQRRDLFALLRRQIEIPDDQAHQFQLKFVGQ